MTEEGKIYQGKRIIRTIQKFKAKASTTDQSKQVEERRVEKGKEKKKRETYVTHLEGRLIKK